MDISEHRFVRTTSAAHKASYSGYYCVGCEKYLDEEEMGPGHTCPPHRTVCKLREEENYFFRLSKCALAPVCASCCMAGRALQGSRDTHACAASWSNVQSKQACLQPVICWCLSEAHAASCSSLQ